MILRPSAVRLPVGPRPAAPLSPYSLHDVEPSCSDRVYGRDWGAAAPRFQSSTGKPHPTNIVNWTPLDIDHCFSIMAAVTANLHRSASQVSNGVWTRGPASDTAAEVQLQILRYLDGIVPALCKGWGLDDVVETTLKRAKRCLEPDNVWPGSVRSYRSKGRKVGSRQDRVSGLANKADTSRLRAVGGI